MDSVKNDPDKQIWGAKRPRGVARSFSILTHGQNVRLNPQVKKARNALFCDRGSQKIVSVKESRDSQNSAFAPFCLLL